MKKMLLIVLALVPALVLLALVVGSSGLPAALAQRPVAADAGRLSGSDPEPALLPPSGPLGPDAPEAVNAILELAWTAPTNDFARSLAWGDYDLDGDLDLAVGMVGANRVYRNTGGNLEEATTLVCDAGAPSENTYSVAWMDYDQDGDLDLAIGNNDGKNCVFRYEMGSDTFERAWRADQVQSTRSIAWAGWTYGGEYTSYFAAGNASEPNAIYRYEAGSFDLWWTDVSSSATNGLAWGDYNNDGYPDLAVANFGPANRIYQNTGSSLSLFFTSPDTKYSRDVAWGDMNNDGYLDLAVGNGQTTGIVQKDQVFCNSGSPNYNFTLCWESDDASPTYGIDWGDYDGDGDLDLAASSEDGGVTRVYVNQNGTLEFTPRYTLQDEFQFSHDVAWADWDSDGDVELGVVYYDGHAQVYNNTNGIFKITSFGPNDRDTRSVAWGDWDGDQDLDLAVGNSANQPNTVYQNDNGSLVLAWTAPAGNQTRSVAWGDFDGDGDQDLAVGNGENNGGRANQLYRNTGGNLSLYNGFTDNFPSNTYAVAWGDYDGDQDLDLAVGNFESNQFNRIYINRHGVFTQTVTFGPSSDQTRSLAWGDFDQDYDLDLLVGNYNGDSKIFVNNGGSFSSMTLPAPNAPCPRDAQGVAWGDWDGDGDLDVALGNAGSSGCVQVLQNDGGVFTSVFQSVEGGLDVRSVAWGDWDGDGDLDLAAGVSGQFGGRNRIYTNTGSGLTRAWVAPNETAESTRSVAWGDYDLDGDLDLAVGSAQEPNETNRVYVNIWNNATNLANDPIRVTIGRPGNTDNAWFYSVHEIIGMPYIEIDYTLFDDEFDRAWKLEPQVSFDGGGNWQTAWESNMVPSSGTSNLPASPNGISYVFAWDALHQLLDHQGIPFDPESGLYVAYIQSYEEMDIAFRMVAWSNPDHGGSIQHPVFGVSSTPFRVDMRPDWYNSAKLSDRQVVHPGEIINYTIAITQADHGMPPSYILDTLPPEMKLVGPATANYGEIASDQRNITWTWQTYAPALLFQDNLYIDFSAVVTRPLTNGLQVNNCAFVFDGMHFPLDRCNTVVISSTPVLTESFKLVGGSTSNIASPGDIMTYTIVLTNTGTDNAHTAIMTDTLPAHVSWNGNLKASAGAASFDGSMITWQGRVNVFKPVTISYQVKVDDPLVGNTIITNTFWAWDGINKPFISDVATTTVLAPDLRTSSKSVNDTTVEVGDRITYTISLNNTGGLAGNPVNVSDVLPSGLTFVPNSLSASSGTAFYNGVTKTITWTGTVPASSVVTIKFATDVAIPSQAPYNLVTNTATISEKYNGTLQKSATINIFLPDVASSNKTSQPSGTVELGDTIKYKLVLKNKGGRAPGLTMSDPMPGGSTFVNGSYTSTDGTGGYQAGSNSVIWNGTLDASEVVTITFDVVAGCPLNLETPAINNSASLNGQILAPVNLLASNPVYLPNMTTSTVSVDKTHALPGENLVYTIKVRNVGGDAPLARMTDLLPNGVTFLGFIQQPAGASYDGGTRTLKWEGPLANSQVITIVFEVQINPGATITQVQNFINLWNGCTTTTPPAAVTLLRTYLYIPLLNKDFK